ncbi:MAG: vanadium-dependent haloperoxidase [Chloroflexota bacterium]|nr:vanadium-dependent haloperoxidase [Chloroflexota bacterium]
MVNNDPATERRPISAFLQLRPQPLGAVYNRKRAHLTGELCDTRCHPQCGTPCGENADANTEGLGPVISTGRELARYFEAETPGITHRQALNYLLLFTNWSPARQALVWMALDVAIYSAITACWYMKWRGPAGVSFRPRPIEYDPRLNVLYNREVNCDGSGDGVPRLFPQPSPGTPRHPAYPSGHSTVAGAASEILSYFFPDFAGEFSNLANNIGMARLWAGIHWRSDHGFGIQLGRRIAQLIIVQLQNSCVTAPPDPCTPGAICPPIPTKADLDSCANACCPTPPTSRVARQQARNEDEDQREAEESTEERRSVSQSGRRRGRENREVSSSAERAQARSPQQGAAGAVSLEDETAQARGPQQGAPIGRSDRAERERARSPQQGAD